VFGWEFTTGQDDYLHIKNGEAFIGGIPPAANSENEARSVWLMPLHISFSPWSRHRDPKSRFRQPLGCGAASVANAHSNPAFRSLVAIAYTTYMTCTACTARTITVA